MEHEEYIEFVTKFPQFFDEFPPGIREFAIALAAKKTNKKSTVCDTKVDAVGYTPDPERIPRIREILEKDPTVKDRMPEIEQPTLHIMLRNDPNKNNAATSTNVDVAAKIPYISLEAPDRLELKTRNGRIPLVLRHEVLKKCGYKCVECGASKEDVPLEIDHIKPVSLGGCDELDNLQLLCKPCNLGKRNRMWNNG